ncbi:MAG: stage V sporulation protein AD [Candidatus Improbicoccus pseudotrichonymphae]|uniref:Stage V sporulation protein AD n=1 Tax=Candidatus Improbicoccus pseudotrichonymphae TaxID=3033792 RepID=A0AA48HV72_9FIRM|nr:MAG: stage V sporulation protein AD [Candidatus Improbicoccus pseudotrichonymphae]
MAFDAKIRVIKTRNCPIIAGFASVGSKKESEGPLGKFLDMTFEDSFAGEDSWERAEGVLQREAVKIALRKTNLESENIDIIFSGDLLDQSFSTIFGLKNFGIPFLGQFGACSTMAQNLILCAVMVDSGFAENSIAVTSSHFCSAERQYRFPLEYGGQRTPCAQWTVTGSGAAVVSNKQMMDKFNKNKRSYPCIEKFLIGKILDFGVNDSSNMGAAMAPAAAQTIVDFLRGTDTVPSDYDLILTGDLGEVGAKLVRKLIEKEGFKIRDNYNDCGLMIYHKEKQDVHAGGSGCGCSASVLCSVVLQRMLKRELNNILFIATGALMSPTSFKQGETIPGIAHLVQIKNLNL